MLNLIVAVDANWGIGKENKLLAHIPEDMRYFTSKTMGHPIIMGRKTFESLPNGALPNRENIVITHDKNFSAENVQVVFDFKNLPNDAFVIGGASIYRQLLPFCDKAYITKIHKTFDADAFMVNLDKLSEWKLVDESEIKRHNDIDFQFCTYARIIPPPKTTSPS